MSTCTKAAQGQKKQKPRASKCIKPAQGRKILKTLKLQRDCLLHMYVYMHRTPNMGTISPTNQKRNLSTRIWLCYLYLLDIVRRLPWCLNLTCATHLQAPTQGPWPKHGCHQTNATHALRKWSPAAGVSNAMGWLWVCGYYIYKTLAVASRIKIFAHDSVKMGPALQW